MRSPRRILVCYFSRTGHTRRLAQELQRALGAEIEELREPRPRKGLRGFVRSALDAITHRYPAIETPRHDPAQFDLLVLGGPIWVGRMASPLRTYAAGPARRAPHIALFCTEAARGADMAFAELEVLCGCERVGSLAVAGRDRERPEHGEAISALLRALHHRLHELAPTGEAAPATHVDTA